MKLYTKYGQGYKYGTPNLVYGSIVVPFDYQIHLYNPQGKRQRVLDKLSVNFNYQWLADGGCGAFTLTVKSRYIPKTVVVSADWEVRLYVQAASGSGFDLWFSGLVEATMQNVAEFEQIVISGMGYMAQLERVNVDRTITSKTVKQIVQDILDTEVTPNTDITYTASDVVGAFSVDSITFSESGFSAIKKLAEIQGDTEWGVDRNKAFYFKARSTTVSHRYILGNDVELVEDTRNFKAIVNRILLKGGLVGGSLFSRTLNDTGSQTTYGLRELIYTDGSITTAGVADQLGTSYFADNAKPTRRLMARVAARRTLIENTIPVGRYAFKNLPKWLYGGTDADSVVRKYGAGFYGEGQEIGYDISTINYVLTDLGMETSFEVGRKRPDIGNVVDRILVELKELRGRDQ